MARQRQVRGLLRQTNLQQLDVMRFRPEEDAHPHCKACQRVAEAPTQLINRQVYVSQPSALKGCFRQSSSQRTVAAIHALHRMYQLRTAGLHKDIGH